MENPSADPHHGPRTKQCPTIVDKSVKKQTGYRVRSPIVLTVFLFVLFPLFGGCSLLERKAKVPPSLTISDVSPDKQEFNPAKGENTRISFKLSRKALIKLEVYDSNGHLISESKSGDMSAGRKNLSWDGRDAQEKIVPDEAYVFLITAKDDKGNKYVYNPANRTGGNRLKAPLKYEEAKGEIKYYLPRAGRVRIRVGVKDGPLMASLVNWVPRPAGWSSEPWDGRDETASVLIPKEKREISTEAFSLPLNAVITRGNPENGEAHPVHPPKSISLAMDKTIRPVHRHARLPQEKRRTPRFSVSFPRHTGRSKEGLPILSGPVPVKIEINEEDRQWLTGIRFEIMLYVDYVFMFEDEDAYTPFTYLWDTRRLNEGEHLLTVNVQGYGDHIGAVSRRVIIRHASGTPGKARFEEAQALIEKIAAKYPQIVRLTIHAVPLGESKSRIIACNINEKIGKLSDPEDLEAMNNNKTIVLREGDNLDVTAPICNKSGVPIAATGITLRFDKGEKEDTLRERAKSIAGELTSKIQNGGKPLW